MTLVAVLGMTHLFVKSLHRQKPQSGDKTESCLCACWAALQVLEFSLLL